MNKQEFKDKIEQLLDEGKGIRQVILDTCMDAVSSIQAQERFLNAAEDNMIFPKQVLTAVLDELRWQYEPIDKKHKRLVTYIKPFVKIQV